MSFPDYHLWPAPFPNRPYHYYLMDDGSTAVPINEECELEFQRWLRWFNHFKRNIRTTGIASGIEVRTSFLGLDHNKIGSGHPILWETRIFGGTYDGYTERYETREDAERNHESVCQKARDGEEWPDVIG